jgi:hypothetical protein
MTAAATILSRGSGKVKAITGSKALESVGNDTLCTWRMGSGVWIQTRSPEYAQRLSRVEGGRLVARSIDGPYLRTFEFSRSWRWASRYVKRVTGFKADATTQQTRSSGTLSGHRVPNGKSKSPAKVTTTQAEENAPQAPK